ncbi:unnamed protein product [Heterosigma akashiwo]
MEGDFGTTKNLHSLPRVKMHLSEWFGAEQGTGFCDNNTVVFEFVVPQDGDLDELTLYKSALNGTLTVEERVKGTNNPTAPGAYGAQKGAVYFFEYDDDDGWVQTDKGTTSSEVGTERFGYSVSIYDDWAIVGAPGEDNEDGKVFVYYPNGDGTWQFYQELEAIDSESWFGHSVDIYGDYLVIGAPKYNNSQGSAHIYYMDGGSNTFGNGTALSTEACLGWSVAVDSDTVVVSAPGNAARQIYLGTEVPDENVQSAGSVFVYEWGADGWGFKQSLLGTNIKLRDRFGHAVATYGDETILVASLEDYIGDLETYKPVQVITTTASGCADDPDGCEKVGSTFRLGWQTTWTSNDEGGAASTVWTSLMESDVTAAELKAALEDELGTGEVTVKRTGPSLTTGGYAWSVTFYDFAPELQADGATLTGAGAAVAVAEAVDVGFFIRSLVHLYRKVDGEWTETAFIAPALLQRQDLFGSSLAIHDQHAMVGAPNRDIFASGLNSGAVLAFKLDFMHLYFDQSNYTVTEGSGLWIDLLRDTCPQLNNIGVEVVRTLDRNADADLEDYVEELFDLLLSPPSKFLLRRFPEHVGAGEAYGRAQYYGSAENRSEWVGGQYDYRGISDYNPLDETVVFQRHSDVLTVGLNTTGDAISEQPDEAVRLTLKLPGAYPSLLGRMTALVTIEDDLDGYLDEENRMGFTKLEFSDPEEDQQFGRAAAIDDAAGILVVGAPNKHRFGREGVGRVYVFQRVLLGTWEETASLYGSQINDTAKAYFGQSVAIDTPYGRNDTTAAAAAPGTAQVYIFVVANCSATCLWEEQSVLTADGVSDRDGFGASGALALDHDILVVGSAQLETIYVYERYYDAGAGGWVWAAAASRRSSDYDYDAITVTNVTHRQDFGRAVGLSGRTLVAGAPYADYNNLGAVGDVSDYDSYGAENLNRGRAYVFYSRPHVQRVTLAAVQEPGEGTFRLRLADRGLNATTAQLGFSASAASMKAALEELANVDEVEVAFASDVDAYAVYRWTVSFVSATVDPPLLVPLYNGSGCADCTPINQAWLTPEQVNVSVVQTIEPWVEQTQLKADDRRSGDLFGYSVAVDGDYTVVVVCPLSSALTCTTWDFETGDLVGWTATGDAFDDQPTFGDNTRHRSVYEGVSDFRSHGAPQVSRHKGRYWVGTYESRPGAGAANYTPPAEGYPLGTAQGTSPRHAHLPALPDPGRRHHLPGGRRVRPPDRVRGAAGGRVRRGAGHGEVPGDDGAPHLGRRPLLRPGRADPDRGRLEHALGAHQRGPLPVLLGHPRGQALQLRPEQQQQQRRRRRRGGGVRAALLPRGGDAARRCCLRLPPSDGGGHTMEPEDLLAAPAGERQPGVLRRGQVPLRVVPDAPAHRLGQARRRPLRPQRGLRRRTGAGGGRCLSVHGPGHLARAPVQLPARRPHPGGGGGGGHPPPPPPPLWRRPLKEGDGNTRRAWEKKRRQLPCRRSPLRRPFARPPPPPPRRPPQTARAGGGGLHLQAVPGGDGERRRPGERAVLAAHGDRQDCAARRVRAGLLRVHGATGRPQLARWGNQP